MLDRVGRLASDLWLDQPDALARIDARVQRGDLDEARAGRLRRFVEEGFLTFHLEGVADLARDLARDIDRFWKERPVDLAYRFIGEPRSMADSVERRERMAPYRILDLHSHSEAALSLYLHPQLFSWMNLILGGQAVAIHSVYSEFGFRETPYRDPVYFHAQPPSYLLCAWISLEDVPPEAGPLFGIRGSHRLPFYCFSDARFTIRPDEEYLPAHRFTLAEARKAGLEEVDFTSSFGQVFLWHASFVHGARPVRNPSLGRRGIMIRFSTRKAYPVYAASYWKQVRGRWWRREERLYWAETRHLLEREGCFGYDNPLRGMNPRGLTVGEKIRSRLGKGKR